MNFIPRHLRFAPDRLTHKARMQDHRLPATQAAAALMLAFALTSTAAELPSVPATAGGQAALSGFDATVEAVRQTALAAQVAGAIVQIHAKAGDVVKAGQPLLRIDATAANQAATASDAQVMAARASLDVAQKELVRQQQLFRDRFISQAALDRAEAEFKATQAQVNVQMAQAGAARTQSGFYLVRAPYAGVVAEVPVSLGDMAMPGRALLTLYDPSALRVTATVPYTVASRVAPGLLPRIELPGLPAARQWVTPARTQLLPTVDASTHTVQLRADLPAGLGGVTPGMFARLWLPDGTGTGTAAAGDGVTVPALAVVRRAEMTGLYVLDPNGRPLLRQVRLGRTQGDRVEILSGLTAGERVVTDPQAAARAR